ncbi:anti-sigma B factor antagonist [Parazoarcus communis]|uniref:Anti-sigma B factor antagonist n=1 Tax=Parazoarcus communis TaxID=41977 RepID=A0A2U8GSR4_9RHOO|nr:STAS domain-containing protein [Parazoarcus communis]AWI76712.1 anti-sigma B factor antagonist [Parazoarcus communis]
MSDSRSGTRVAIVDDMTIYNASAQKQQLLDALAVHDEIEIDLSAVAEIDTAGIQLLILVKREASRLGKRAVLVAHSAAVREVVDFFNLAASFGDPMLIPAREG